MSLKVLERSSYGTPLRIQIDRFHFRKLEDSLFYQCTALRCKFRLLISRSGDSFVPEFFEGASHNHEFENSFRVHLECGKTRICRLWYFNRSEEVSFAALMKRFFAEEIARLIASDSERVCCSLMRIAANGENETVGVSTVSASDDDDFVFLYRSTSVRRKETSDTVVVLEKTPRKSSEEGMRQSAENDQDSAKTNSSLDSDFLVLHDSTSVESRFCALPPSESGQSTLSDVLKSVRRLFPVTAQLVAECIDGRQRLLARLREIAVFDASKRTLGTFLLNSSAHIVRQTVTLERLMLASHQESFFVPQSVCNAMICRCSYHFYRNRPCPQLFLFNYCKVCHRARRFHFYVKNCSGIPLESLRARAVVFGAKLDSFSKMQKELQEVLARFANVLAAENSRCAMREMQEDIEEDVRTILCYRSLNAEFSKCFRGYKDF